MYVKYILVYGLYVTLKKSKIMFFFDLNICSVYFELNRFDETVEMIIRPIHL